MSRKKFDTNSAPLASVVPQILPTGPLKPSNILGIHCDALWSCSSGGFQDEFLINHRDHVASQAPLIIDFSVN